MSIVNPSYAHGFARSAGESMYPELWRGLVSAYVPQLGPTGGTIHDALSPRNDGTLVNMELATDWVVTPDGYALNFGGTDEHVLAGANVPDLAKPWTLTARAALASSPGSAWGTTPAGFYLGSSEAMCIFFYNATGNNWLKIGSQGETPGYGSIALAVGVTYHLAVIHDGSDLFGYINGVLDYQVTPTGSGWQTCTHKILGGFHPTAAGGNFLDGKLWEVLIYNHAIPMWHLRTLVGDPLAMFRPRPRVFKAGAAGGGGGSLLWQLQAEGLFVGH